MYRRTKKLFAAALVLTMLLTMTVFQGLASAATTTTRLGGNNRYETAAKIATEGWATGAATVVLVRGDESADALVAAPLAKLNNAPILLTASNELSAATKTALTTLKATKVIIVGGTKAVSDTVKTAIEAMNITVSRVSGDSRYETSVNVAKELGTFTEVALANAYAPADALSVSAIAAAKGMPILFTDKASLPKAVSDFLAGKTVKAYLIGGTGVVSDAVYAGATRLGGNDRYATNREVLKGFADVKYDKVFLATSEGADALTGSALAAKTFSPIVLVDKTFDAATLTFVAEKATTSASVVALGGATVVTDEAVATLSAAINNAKFQVTEVKAINATQLMVKFNKPVDKTDAEKVAKYSIGTVNPTSAALQADKVSVLLTMGSVMSGTKLYVVDPILLADSTTVKTAIFTYVETYSDTVAPAVKGVTYPSYDKATVTFTEPLSTLGNVTATQDGNTITLTPVSPFVAGDSSITYNLAGNAADKNITIAIVGARDQAGNMMSPNPTTVTIIKVKSDTTKPTVVSVTPLSDKRVSVVFSEKLNGTVPSITIGGTNTTVTTDDNVTYVGTLAGAVTGAKLVQVSGYTDLSNNNGDAYSVLKMFAADTTKPSLLSYEVKVISGVQYLVLHFNEAVDAGMANIVGTYEKDAVSYDVTKSNVVPEAYNDGTNTDSKAVMINISSYTNGLYNVTVGAGIVNDKATAPNPSVAFAVTFTKGTVSPSSDSTVPHIDSVVFSANNTYLTVTFSEPVDPATAKNISNYTINGTVMFSKAELYNNPAVVRLTVAPGTILYNGDYWFAVSGVKDLALNAMTAYGAPLTCNENVAPVVTSAKLINTTTINVNVSEALDLATFTGSDDLKVKIGDTVYSVSDVNPAVTHVTYTAGNTYFTITLVGSAEVVDLGKAISVEVVGGLADVNGNLLKPVTVSVTY